MPANSPKLCNRSQRTHRNTQPFRTGSNRSLPRTIQPQGYGMTVLSLLRIREMRWAWASPLRHGHPRLLPPEYPEPTGTGKGEVTVFSECKNIGIHLIYRIEEEDSLPKRNNDYRRGALARFTVASRWTAALFSSASLLPRMMLTNSLPSRWLSFRSGLFSLVVKIHLNACFTCCLSVRGLGAITFFPGFRRVTTLTDGAVNRIASRKMGRGGQRVMA